MLDTITHAHVCVLFRNDASFDDKDVPLGDFLGNVTYCKESGFLSKPVYFPATSFMKIAPRSFGTAEIPKYLLLL
jgi:hypothetical protein